MPKGIGITQRKRRQNIIGWVITCSVVLIIVIFFATRLTLVRARIKLDETTLCPETGPVAYLAVLLDGTDSFNDVQKVYLTRYFQEVKQDLRIHEQISLFTVNNESLRDMKPKLVVCNPGDEANPLIQNPRKIRLRWEKKYYEHLTEALNVIMKTGKSDYSPIMEMIQAITINGFPRESINKEKRLLIVSDMLHHTDRYSLYRQEIDFKKFRETPHFQHVRTNLSGIEVIILFLMRESHEELQTEKLITFWKEYIHSMGGRLSHAQYVDG